MAWSYGNVFCRALNCELRMDLTERDIRGGGGGGDSRMNQTGMLVVLLRGVNFGFWSRLGCSGQSSNMLCHQGLV